MGVERMKVENENMTLNRFGFERLLGVALILGALLQASSVWAVDFFLKSDQPFTSGAISTSERFFFNILPDRSYCIEMQTTTGPSWAFVNSVDPVDPDLTIVVSDRGHATPQIYPLFAPNLTPKSRRCFLSSGTLANISDFRLQTTLGFTGQNLGVGVLIRLFESTLTGGFNTSVTNFNFLELTNNLISHTRDSGVITGKITMKNVITDQIIRIQNFTVNASDRIDVSIHDAAGPGVFGTITVVHNGPAGGLKGVVSQYRIVRTSPLDFEPVLQQPLLRPNGLP